MRYEKLFVVNTRSMQLEQNYLSSFAKELSKIINLDSYKYIDVPFKKTENIDVSEYVEMLTGTLYYRKDDKFISKDSLVSFTVKGMEYYDNEKFGEFCNNHSLLLARCMMQFVYQKERIKAKKEKIKFNEKGKSTGNLKQKGEKTLLKLEKKHKNKIIVRK